MKICIQRIDTCRNCPFCWAGEECIKLNRYFEDQDYIRAKTDVQAWCPLPDESDDKK